MFLQLHSQEIEIQEGFDYWKEFTNFFANYFRLQLPQYQLDMTGLMTLDFKCGDYPKTT